MVIYRDGTFDRLPGPHVRGCWVVVGLSDGREIAVIPQTMAR
jgi:hypothetical protein